MKFITWNMQGSSHQTENKWNVGVASLLNQHKGDVICLQECGAWPETAEPQKKYGGIPFSGDKPNKKGMLHGYEVTYLLWGIPEVQTEQTKKLRSAAKHILYVTTDVSSNRVNLAVVSIHQPIQFVVPKPGLKGARPPVGIKILPGGWFVFSVHDFSPGGNDAASMLQHVKVELPKKRWAVLGDFNREPENLTVPQGAYLCPPNMPTRKALKPKQYDYMVNTVGVSTGEALGLELADHYPVLFDLIET